MGMVGGGGVLGRVERKVGGGGGCALTVKSTCCQSVSESD